MFLNGDFVAKGTVSLTGAAIGGNLGCGGSTFEGHVSLILERTKVTGSLYLDDGFRASGVIDLIDLTVDGLVDAEASWTHGRLLLDGFTCRRFAGDAPVDAAARLRWLDCQHPFHLTHDFRPQPWEQCAKVLAEMGHDRDARRVRIAKRRRTRNLGWLRANFVGDHVSAAFSFAGDLILDVTTGYGWRPWNALVGILILWAVAGWGYGSLPPGVMAPADALVYFSPRIPEECKTDWITLDPRSGPLTDARQIAAARDLGLPDHKWNGLSIVPEWKEICTRAMPSEYSTFSPFAYALDVLLPIVDLRQEKDWSPRVTDASGEVIGRFWPTAPYQWLRDWGIGYVARLLEWVLILFGWTLSALLLGAVTGVIRRD